MMPFAMPDHQEQPVSIAFMAWAAETGFSNHNK